MKVDIIPAPAEYNGWEVRPRDGAPVLYDGEYEKMAIFGPAADSECMDWCEQHGHEFRHRKNVAMVTPKFFKDLETRCDMAYEVIARDAEKLGWKLVSNATYRTSAAWKDEPIHYCYRGDYGGAEFTGTTEETVQSELGATTLRHLDWLRGVSTAVWELGFALTFDKEGKHTIYNKMIQWVTLDEVEW